MKIYKLYLLLVLTFYSCNLRNEEKTNIFKEKETDSSNIVNQSKRLDYYIKSDSIAIKSIKGIPQLNYKFNVDSTGYFLKSIFVYSKLVKIQEIIENKSFEKKEFKLIDCNFDGYKDISVLYNCGSGGCAYWIWNYSPESKKYYYNKELSEVLGLEIDTISKLVKFHYREGSSKEN